jgi:hypothetical protein
LTFKFNIPGLAESGAGAAGAAFGISFTLGLEIGIYGTTLNAMIYDLDNSVGAVENVPYSSVKSPKGDWRAKPG